MLGSHPGSKDALGKRDLKGGETDSCLADSVLELNSFDP